MSGGIQLSGLGYRYPTGQLPACADVDLVVAPGQVVLVTGPTGCGKSTLVRLAAGLLQRHGAGQVMGSVRVGGLDPASCAPVERVAQLGLVGQEPGDQLVAGTIADEVAFGLESLGLPADEIARRIPQAMGLVGLDLPLERDPRTLSGGQTQRLVTAAALSGGAGALVLDEPLAQLDPKGADDLMAALRTVADTGVAVLLVEHRLEACWDRCDRVVVMDAGRIVDDAVPAEVGPGHALLGTLRRLGLQVPGPLDLLDRLGHDDLSRIAPPVSAPEPVLGPELFSTQLSWRWPGSATPALAPMTLALRAGERLALLGANGAGKSSLLRVLSGDLELAGHTPPPNCVAVPQDPDLALFCERVRDELAYGPQERRLPDVAQRVAAAAQALSVDGLLDRAPQALSRGQRLRVAVAAALSCGPQLLLLDEPTSGQDHDQVEAMLQALTRELADGALIFATHDVGLALRHATTVLVLDQGQVVAGGAPVETLRNLPPQLPLLLPPLVRRCLAAGLPPLSAAQLAERA